MTTSPLVLGIDAGGTKTAAAVATATTILGYGKSGPGNLRAASQTEIVDHFRKAVRRALKEASLKSSTKFTSIVVGMSGLDTTVDHAHANTIVRKALTAWMNTSTTLSIVNDIHIVRRSGSNEPYGLALIAGTGSHGFGINKKGQTAHVSGLGKLLADEGSGYWIGHKAIQAAARSYDGRTKKTNLETVVCQHFKVSSVRDVLTKLPQATKADIATLAIDIENQASKGDWAAKAILESALDELELQVATLIRKLRLSRSEFDIIVVGGMFHMPKYPFLKKFKQRVKKIAPKAVVHYPEEKPVQGAIHLAQDSLQA